MIFTDYRKHLKSPYSYYYYFLFGEATAKSRENISELTFKPCLEYAWPAQFRYLMRIQDMVQNSFFPDAIDREAIKARANAQPQNNLPD